jgi:multidrug efflux pump subunit AcrB
MLNEVRYVPGAADARIQQPFDYPNMTVNVDRTRAEDIGLTQANVAQSVLVALSGSFQTAPNFYLDPRTASPTTSPFRPRSTAWTRSPPWKVSP